MEKRYTAGTVMTLLATDYVTVPTRHALEERIQKIEASPVFFTQQEFDLLTIVCNRLMAQDDARQIVNMALFIDERLKDHTGDGWRYNAMPPDDEMYHQGLKGIDETSLLLYQLPFIQLTVAQQKEILYAIQKGTAGGATWQQMSPMLFFEELLAEAAEIFYSHPLVQEEIGYVGMADAKGWINIGLNEKDAIEPEAMP